MVSGAMPSRSRQSKWYTNRLRGRTGSSAPTMAATLAARGPAAFTTSSVPIRRPSARRTPAMADPSRSIASTSPATYSTPSERALRRNAWSRA